MSLFIRTFTAGQTIDFRGGNQFIYMVGTDPIDVTYLKNGSEIEKEESARPGYSNDLSRNDNPEVRTFDAVRIRSATAQTIEIAITDYRGNFNTIAGQVSVSGNVSVLDGIPMESYEAGLNISRNASNQCWLTFFNPVSSGKIISMRKIWAKVYDHSFSSSFDVSLYRITQDMASHIVTFAAINKLLGSATASPVLLKGRNNTTTSPAGTLTGTELTIVTSQVAGSIEHDFIKGSGLTIEEGHGVMLRSSIDTRIDSQFEWDERDV